MACALWCATGCDDPVAVDGGVLADGGVPADVGLPDAAPDDAGAPDAAPADVGFADAAPADAGFPDAAPADAGAPDAGPPDSGTAVCGDGRVTDEEVCDPGVEACCRMDCTGPLPGDTVCRASAGACDLVERCDGVAAACPADAVRTSTVTCRPRVDACDAIETCDGVDVACPPDQLAAMGEICRPMANDCDVPETCSGAALDCPADGLAPDATPCLSCPGVTASCGGCYAGVCVDAQELCADILAQGMSIGDGVYTIAPDPVATSTAPVRTVPAYCDMTTGGGGWTLIYKKSPTLPGNAGAMFTGTPTRARDLTVLGRFPSPDYVSDFHVTAWSAFTQVRVEILTGTVATRFIEFDAVGSTPTDWFSADRHTASSWTDLPTASNWEGSAQGRFFSIDPSGARKFYVNRTWGGCPADLGWLMISSTDFCPWERRTTQPNEIIYSAGATEARFDDANQVGYGDAFLIWAR